MILRDEIAELIEPHIAEDDWGEGLHLTLADRILAILREGGHLKEDTDAT